MGIDEVHNLNHVQSFGAGHAAHQRVKEEIQGFGELIQEKAGDRLSFSRHAAKRLGEGNIAIGDQLLGGLGHAMDKARKRGSKDVAVIGSQGMFIMNISNSTTITTVSQDDTRNRISASIDSAVFMQAGPDGGPANYLRRAGRGSKEESVC